MAGPQDPQATAPEELEPEGSAIERGFTKWAIPALLLVLIALLIVILLLMMRPERSSPVVTAGAGLESVFVLTGPGTGDKPTFRRPLASAYGPQADIYVSDTGNGRICVFDRNGGFEREFGRLTADTPADERKETLEQPVGLAVDDDGFVYVADLQRGALLVFDDDGEYRDSFVARKGWRPTDVAVSDDTIAVADAQGITLLSFEGEVTDQLTQASPGSRFFRPNGVAFTAPDTLAVSDTNNARIVSIGVDGEAVWEFTGDAAAGRVVGLPRGIAAAPDGSIVYADAFRFALVRVSASGEFAATYGLRGTGPAAFEYPNDVDVRDDLALVADKDNNRVQVVRFIGD